MKKLMVSLFAVLMLCSACSSLPPSKPAEPCEPAVLRAEESEAGDVLAWFDMDCDKLCDTAAILVPGPAGWQVLAQMECEQAEEVFQHYGQMMKEREGKGARI